MDSKSVTGKNGSEGRNTGYQINVHMGVWESESLQNRKLYIKKLLVNHQKYPKTYRFTIT